MIQLELISWFNRTDHSSLPNQTSFPSLFPGEEGAREAPRTTTLQEEEDFNSSKTKDSAEAGNKAIPRSTTADKQWTEPGETTNQALIDAMQPNLPDVPVGGRLRIFYHRWAKLTSDPAILDTVKGMHIDLDDVPTQTSYPRQIIVSPQEQQAASEHLQTLLDKKAIIQCSDNVPGQYLSNIFMIPKRDFGWRMILNLKSFNRFATYVHFKMSTLNHILSHISPFTYMAVFDFCDAYLTIPIAGEHVKFLRFRFNGLVFKHVVLPFGISSAPRKFTKLLVPILTFFRRQAIVIIAYLDDGFTCASSFQLWFDSICYIMRTFSYYGFILHKKKLAPYPSTKVRSLRFYLDSVKMIITLPNDKTEYALFLCNTVLSQSQCSFTILFLAKLIGTFISLFPACPLGRAHYRTLERLKVEALRISGGNFDAYFFFNSEAIQDITWWVSALPCTAAPIHRGLPTDTITTDSSNYGWNGFYNNISANGFFTPTEKDNIIAFKELLAIYYSLRSFYTRFSGTLVRIRSDSVTAGAYLRDMGGMKNIQMDSLARDIWSFAETHQFWITVTFVPGADNEADAGSRLISSRTEWTIPQLLFNHICSCLSISPTVDLFASSLNACLPRYSSWFPDPYCTFVDSLSFSWKNEIPYLFPPFSLIHRCLQRIRMEQLELVLMIFPLWTSQHWMSQLLQLTVSTIYLLPQDPPLFLPWETIPTPHPLGSSLMLAAVLLSGNTVKLNSFRSQLETSSVLPLDHPPK